MKTVTKLFVRLSLVLVVLTVPVLGWVGPASAATPVWDVSVLAAPTQWEPNMAGIGSNQQPPYLHIELENVGNATTSGPFTLKAVLPPGVTYRSGEKAESSWNIKLGAHLTSGEVERAVECSASGSTVECVGPVTNPVAVGYGPLNVRPGEGLFVNLPVATDSTIAGSLPAEVTITGGGAQTEAAAIQIPVSSSPPVFGFLDGDAGAAISAGTSEGAGVSAAGAHPSDLRFTFRFPTQEFALPPRYLRTAGEGPKDISVTLPRGVVVNPAAVPVKCTEAQLESRAPFGGTNCPASSQVGVVLLTTGPSIGGQELQPVFAMPAPRGTAALFGFEAVSEGVYLHLSGKVNSEGSYELVSNSREISNKFGIAAVSVDLWGNPGDSVHDYVRGECATLVATYTCPMGGVSKPLVSLPSQCSAAMEVEASTDSWEQPAVQVRRSFGISDRQGNTLPVTDCGSLVFQPSISARPTADLTDSPTGLSFVLHQPQNQEPDERATSTLKNAVVTLPEGMTLNPSSANGLGACTEEQIGRTTLQPLRFSEQPQTCPSSSKVGTVSVRTPLLDHALPGSVYVAKPFGNPFNSLLAIYLAIEDEASGVISKLAGKVEPDPVTGRLVATFEESPELPLEDIGVNFFGGSRAALKQGMVCGSFATTARLTPWSAPQASDVSASDVFTVDGTPGGEPCPTTEAAAPAKAELVAGTAEPLAGAFSSLTFHVARNDGSQQFSSLEATLPPGLLGRLAGIPYCPQSAIGRAESLSAPNDGQTERATPSCPSASKVGTVDVTAGAGSTPVSVSGEAYLAGPYKGAPLSLEIITPAVAGPFDLGVVAVRTALNVDPLTAQVHAISDPLPRILHGIPLDVRSVTLQMNRPNFILNPTNCEPMQVAGTIATFSGATVPLAQRFQVEGCKRLKFKPNLKIKLRGSTKRTGFPALKAVVTYPKKGAFANIARAQVNLPHSEFLEQNNLTKTCTKPVLLEGKCPKSTIYGKAKAWTPLLDDPVQGPVYLVGGFGYKLPALVAELNGQIRVLLKGKVDSGPNGGIRNTFEAVPDAPVSRFVLEMKGGKKYGLLINSENLCKKPQRAVASFKAQNGLVVQSKPLVQNACGRAKTKR